MFRGQHVHAIDAKGRTSFPARFRAVLEERGDLRLFLVRGLDNSVAVYPYAEWIEFEAKIAARPQFDPNVRKVLRLFVSSAVDAEFDKVGRILIPQTLRDHAKLGREVIWAGMTKHIEVYDRERFEASLAEDQTPEGQQDLAQALAELGL